MSGSASVDSFDSSDSSKSTNGLYDPLKRQIHGNICTDNSTSSDLRNTFVYGDLHFSGPVIKNTGNVQGTISTPFFAPIPPTSDPSWATGSFTQYTGGGNPPALGFVASGSQTNPTKIKVDGDFTVPGGKSFRISSSSGSDSYLVVWVTGKFTTSGSGMTQEANVHVTWIVDKDITTSGDSYNNRSGRAGNTAFVGVGIGKATVSGGSNFIGTIDAPARDVTISGTGAYSGGVTASTLTISGGGALHYDEALTGPSAHP